MTKKLSALLVLLLIATSLVADEPIRRTIVVRDGNVLMDETDPPVKRAFVGVSLTELTPELREFFGAPKDAGVLVSSVSENGPAAKAGVRVGDVITAVNGKTTAVYRDLRAAIRDNHAGDSIRIELIRGKARQSVVATAEEREGAEARMFNLPEFDKHLMKPLPKEWKGFMISPEDDDLRAQIRALEKRLQELEKRLQQK